MRFVGYSMACWKCHCVICLLRVHICYHVLVMGETTIVLASVPMVWLTSQRIPYLIQVVPCMYMIVAGFLVPETPRFLMARGREADALEFFVRYHGNGDPSDELVQFEYRELQEALEREKSAQAIGWMEILKGKGNKHRLGLVCLMTFLPQMNGGNIIYYYCEFLRLSTAMRR